MFAGAVFVLLVLGRTEKTTTTTPLTATLGQEDLENYDERLTLSAPLPAKQDEQTPVSFLFFAHDVKWEKQRIRPRSGRLVELRERNPVEG